MELLVDFIRTPIIFPTSNTPWYFTIFFIVDFNLLLNIMVYTYLHLVLCELLDSIDPL